jgi:GTPase
VFVDQVTIRVSSGAGGAGCVSFRREKYVPKGGPDGGNGGNGGDVIMRSTAQLHTLLDHRYHREYQARDGEKGSSSRCEGKRGQQIIISVPCGTIVRDAETNEILVDLVRDGQEVRILSGGRGGRGNAEFATAVNQAPRRAETGQSGKSRDLVLELKLIADIGLVGIPNVGKSTLISVISAARPKIAAYPFTTLQPNLGIVRVHEYDSFTVADIPGLIEGAHTGRGLGLQFLRHIERTRFLLFLIDVTSTDYHADLHVLQDELSAYSPALLEKPSLVVITKMDLSTSEEQERIRQFSVDLGAVPLMISSATRLGVEELKVEVWRQLHLSDEIHAPAET